MTSSDLPFQLRGGQDEQTAIHNRIAAIERIKFLSGGIDLTKKSVDFLRAFDLEMWTRWYRYESADKLIDEEWCQRAAQVAIAMEKKDVEVDEEKYKVAREEHQSKLEKINVD